MFTPSRRSLGILLAVAGLLMVVAGFFVRGHSDQGVQGWMSDIRRASKEAEVDPYLLAGLVYAESRGQADAVSSVGALGLCQLMPPTAAELAGQMEISGPPYRPLDNLRMGATYLAKMLKRHDGDVDLALLSYRLGPARVRRQMKAAGGREPWIQSLKDRSPSPWNYCVQILEAQKRYAALESGSNES